MNLNEEIISILNENYCIVLPKNSQEVFVFWKFSKFKFNQFLNSELNKKITLKLFDLKGNKLMEISHPYNENKLYITIPKYTEGLYAEIHANSSNKSELIATSNTIKLSYEREIKERYLNI